MPKWGHGSVQQLKEDAKIYMTGIKNTPFIQRLQAKFDAIKYGNIDSSVASNFSHIYRRKTRLDLTRISAAVMGIEFCYAAETAFVSPTLLHLGVSHVHMTLVWCLSPLIGFFLTPVLGSLSDQCRSSLGRRRPFILLLSFGIVLGLLLVPNGKDLGLALGDVDNIPSPTNFTNTTNTWINQYQVPSPETTLNATNDKVVPSEHTWGIFFTILGTVLLDFDSDACQSPSRAYLLDVVVPEDHAKGLSTFTIMAGLGGALGYSMGGFDWDSTSIGEFFGGHVRAVFTLILFIFIVCVLMTVTSFQELPLDIAATASSFEHYARRTSRLDQSIVVFNKNVPTDSQEKIGVTSNEIPKSYGTAEVAQNMNTDQIDNACNENKHTDTTTIPNEGEESKQISAEISPILGDTTMEPDLSSITLQQYLLSILHMPSSIRNLCITNLFSWMSLICYSLYFTDFVGEAVFGGDPKALQGSPKHTLYEEGIRFGSFGMALYSISCSVYSFTMDKLIKTFGAKCMYVFGPLVYCSGMILMALTQTKTGVLMFSCTAGIMYSTLFTMPYLLVANYHAKNMFSSNANETSTSKEVRGMGTDVAVVGSMVFLAQFLLSACMGYIVSVFQSTVAIVIAAAMMSFCAAIAATQITYLDL